MMPAQKLAVKSAASDNIAIIISPAGVPANTLLSFGVRTREFLPMGHKVALESIPKDGEVIRYGQVIAHAVEPISKGAWVNETNTILPAPPDLSRGSLVSRPAFASEPLEGYTFQGYRNSDGGAGTKNVLGITTSVQCVAGLAQHVAEKVRRELLPAFPNVDDVVALKHHYGCGIAIDAPAAVIPIRTIRNIARNPNFGDEVMMIGLGCEKLRPEILAKATAPRFFTCRILP